MSTLSADRPKTDPKDDLFGHARFAENLADSIRLYSHDDGLVLALYGAWGSGKSTVLNYVKHHLEQRSEEERPTIVPFNPWWFTGQDSLALAFFGQLQAALSDKKYSFKKRGILLIRFVCRFVAPVARLMNRLDPNGGVAVDIAKFVKAISDRESKNIPRIKRNIEKKLKK